MKLIVLYLYFPNWVPVEGGVILKRALLMRSWVLAMSVSDPCAVQKISSGWFESVLQRQQTIA